MFKSLITIFCLILLFSSEALAAEGNPGWWQGVDTPAFAGGVIRDAYCDVISYMEGTLGAMLMAAAGVMAMGVAAFGDFKHVATAVAVGIATVCMSTVVGLFFGQLCGGGGQARVAAGVADINTARTNFATDQLAPDIDFEAGENSDNNSDPFDL